MLRRIVERVLRFQRHQWLLGIERIVGQQRRERIKRFGLQRPERQRG